MNTLELLDKWIKERGSADVLLRHLEFARDQCVALEKRIVDLEKEVAGLKGERDQLARALEAERVSEEWIQYRGALLKPLPSGGFEPDAYCKICRRPLTPIDDHFPMQCTTCRTAVGFTPSDLWLRLRTTA